MIIVIFLRMIVTAFYELNRAYNDFSDTNNYFVELVVATLSEIILVAIIIHSIRWSLFKK